MMPTHIVSTQHSFDELLKQMGRKRMTVNEEPSIKRPSSAYLKINALKPPTAQQIAQVKPDTPQAQWLEYMFMREQLNLWLQRNATPFTPDDAMRQDVAAYLTGVRANEVDINGTPAPADNGGLRPLRTRDLLAKVDWWQRTHDVIAWRVATSRLDGTDYWTLRENRPMPPQYEELLPYAYLHPRFPYVDDTATTSSVSWHPTIHAYAPVLNAMEGLWGFAEATNIIRGKNRPPHVITSNGGMVSVGGDSTMFMDGTQEAAAFAAGLKLSDDTVVAFVLGLYRWCEQANRRDRRTFAVVTVDEYCQARGWKKHHKGGYKPAHKAKARDEMMALNKVWVRHRVPDHLVTSDGTRYVEGPLMTVERGFNDKLGQNTTTFRVSPGSWADDYLEDNPNCIALVLENVLRIDTRKTVGQLAQRLGLYMALQWRTKFLNNNGGQAHRVKTLLNAVGIDPETVTNREERRRIRAYLTGESGALDQLQGVEGIGTRDEAGVLVDDWHYKNEEASVPDADVSWGAWLDWTIIIPAPREVMDFYEAPLEARQATIKEGIARKRRRERAIDAAKAKMIAQREAAPPP